MNIAHFDCFCGAAGDMIVAALLDAGADAGALQAHLQSLPIAGYKIHIEKKQKQGVSATRFDVQLDPHQKQQHRHLKHVLEIIQGAKLPDRVRLGAQRIFARLAEAEATVHGTTVEKVHFHEVGAIDAIVDVVGACLALELLGIDRVTSSAIPTGSGTINCDHGILPVPGPATAKLLEGVPIAACDEVGELTTPTGAAILTALADSFGGMPPMTLRRTGYGAGTRDGKNRPNVLRVMIGEASDDLRGADTEQIVALETSIDDATPQQIAYCIERLFNEGALDAYAMPIHMKKGRTGVSLTALGRVEHAERLERIVFAETPTLGLRRQLVSRRTLPRRVEKVVTRFGEIRMKVAGGTELSIRTATPEYEDCRQSAIAYAAPLREVMEAAMIAWQLKQGDTGG